MPPGTYQMDRFCIEPTSFNVKVGGPSVLHAKAWPIESATVRELSCAPVLAGWAGGLAWAGPSDLGSCVHSGQPRHTPR